MAEGSRPFGLGRLLPRTRSHIPESCMKYTMVLAVILILQIAMPAHAQLPFGLGASETTQLLNHGELVNQYLRQAEQLAEALKQTSDMIKNSQLLATQAFGPITSDINQLSQVDQGRSALAYS